MAHAHNPDVREFLKGLSAQDFLKIGIHEIAYIRPVMETSNAQNPKTHTGFSIHAADGTPLSVMATKDLALAALRNNDLIPVTLH
jgi:hypothetical protein